MFDKDSWQAFKAWYWLVKLGQKHNSPVSKPSCGKPQAGYRLLKSRLRVPRVHVLVSVVDVLYSDSYEGIVEGVFPRRFFPIVRSTKRPPSTSYNRSLIAKGQQLASIINDRLV